MAYETPVNPADLEMHVTPGCTDAAVYQNGVLADHGHYDDVIERLVENLGVLIEHGSNPFLARDERGRTAPAAGLDDLAALQQKASL